MAGFGFDDDNFSLSGLTQEGHEYDVTTIISSTDDENYDGLMECARKLTGENSEGGVHAGVRAMCQAICRARSLEFADF